MDRFFHLKFPLHLVVLLQFLTLLFFALESSAAYAQAEKQAMDAFQAAVTAEKPAAPACPCPDEKEKKSDDWELGLSFGFNMSKGNADTRLLAAGINANREKDNNIYKLVFSGAEGEQESVTNQRFVRGDASYDRLVTERTYLGIGTTFLSDDIADVDYRTISNLSAGYFLLKDDDLKFSIETGPAYVFEKQGGVKDNFFAWRFGNDFSWQFSESGKIFQRAAFLLNTDDTNDYLLIAKAGVEAALNSWLSLVFAIEDRFDNSPAPTAKKNDVLITSSLKVSF
ncbi:MAG TPA: DUF481 domain-containing protein [Oligoflexia bacterium]|nr:DUF481 domain-containing protein [Oligoflexia bacterium]HMP47769.1 DUF481 domain-containing protein [Oligoflexia bacterium]